MNNETSFSVFSSALPTIFLLICDCENRTHLTYSSTIEHHTVACAQEFVGRKIVHGTTAFTLSRRLLGSNDDTFKQ